MADSSGDMRILIEQIAQGLVDHPDQVTVNQVEDEHGILLELKVMPDDVGKVIGRQGRTVRALRHLLSAASLRSAKRFELEILE